MKATHDDFLGLERRSGRQIERRFERHFRGQIERAWRGISGASSTGVRETFRKGVGKQIEGEGEDLGGGSGGY